MKTLAIVIPTFNEEENIIPIFEAVKLEMAKFEDRLSWSVCFIDNRSTDGTRQQIRQLHDQNSEVRAIFNRRNFGQVRSPAAGILAQDSDGVAAMAADFQDAPSALGDMVSAWLDEGHLLVLAQRRSHADGFIMKQMRSLFYYLMNTLGENRMPPYVTGFGVYDKVVIDELREVDDRYPFIRGLVIELGFSPNLVQFDQPSRRRGISSHNFFSLYDIAFMAISKYSILPLRLSSFLGFGCGLLSIFGAFYFLFQKLANWENFELGIAPIIVFMLFLFSLVFVILGFLGEYILNLSRANSKVPLVVIEEQLD